MNYVQLKCVAPRDEARCMLLRNYENKYKLSEGMPLGGEFPEDAEFRMSDDFPTALTLVDVLYVLENVLVVTPRVRDLLQQRGTPDLEFLAVNVINHKGRKTKESYLVVNLLRVIDCIDKSKTTWEPNALDPDAMTDVENLTLDESRIDPNAEIFRPAGLRTIMVARRDLADYLKAAGVKGLGVSEIADFES